MTRTPPTVPPAADVVIIGGGVIGLSIAFHLAECGVRDVVLLERNTLTSGTSWHAAGIVGPLRATHHLTELATYAIDLFGELEARTGQASGYQRTGGMWLATRPERMVELARMKDMADMSGLHARFVSHDDIAAAVPGMRLDGIEGALWVDEDGQADATGVCMAYAAGARAAGIRIVEGMTACGVTVDGDRVAGLDVTETANATARHHVRCRAVVNAAGVWARRLGAQTDVPVPVQAVQHMYVVTEALDGLPSPHPIVRDLDAGVYIKADGNQLLTGGFEYDAKVWDPDGPDGSAPFVEFGEDWEQFAPFMEAAIHRYPVLGEAGIRHFLNGPEGFTHDTAPVIGEAPDLAGYFVCAGFNSLGLMSSAGVGRVMADWIATGEVPDLFGLDISRVDPVQATTDHLHQRMRESVGDQFAMHWPFKQIGAGRDLRRSPLHDRWADAGAQFGVTATWERPLWFGAPVPYDNTSPAWWPMVAAEVQAMTAHAALLELTPFSKFDIVGPGAEAFLQWVCAADLALDVDELRYTQLLNHRGGVEMDGTVDRRSVDRFRLTGGAPTRWRDLGRIRRLAAQHGDDVSIEDRTEDEATIGLFGPAAPAILEQAAGRDAITGMRWATSRSVTIAGRHVRVSRVSYVGEAGCELTCERGDAAAVADALTAVDPRLGRLGLYGIDDHAHVDLPRPAH